MTGKGGIGCIICGKGRPVHSGLCADCLGQRRRFIDVPEFTELVSCAHCGSVVIGKRWKDARSLERELAAAAERATKVEDVEGARTALDVKVRLLNESNADAEVTATVRFGKEGITQAGKTRIRIRRTVCERCSKIHGRYYEAVLQIRATGRPLTESEKKCVKEEVHRHGEKGKARQEFIAREEQVDGGLDFQLGTINRAKAISRALAGIFGGRITESSKLAGAKLGKELHRVTFLVRLPGLKEGDFARLGETVFLVTHAGPKGISAMDLATGTTILAGEKELEAAKRLGGPEISQEAVVLQARRPEVQIMDPASFKPVSIVAPEWFWKMQNVPESVRVLKNGEETFLVPGD